jgi:3-oxoacyl-(acyl-carrier-protein) synthase
MSTRLILLGFGAVTAVGVTAAQTCAAIRGALTGFNDSNFFHHDPPRMPMVAAQVPLDPRPDQEQTFDRLVRLAAAAIRECLDDSGVDPRQTALTLNWREPFREDFDLDGKDAALLAAIEETLGVRFHAASRVIRKGKAGAFLGLRESRVLLTTGVVSACVTGGVDSYLNVDDVVRFQSVYRIKREGVAPRGFIPGEGAAFIAVAAPGRFGNNITRARGEILGVGLATEDPSVTVLSDGHPTGKGLQRALEGTIQDADLPESCIDFRVSDQSGEIYHTVESTLALSRFYRTHRDECPLWLPAASVGEIGAAVGPLMVIMASVAMEKNYAPGALAMCEASSDEGLRAGCLVGPATASRDSSGRQVSL